MEADEGAPARLAPVVLIRAALFPLKKLMAFADPEIAATAVAASTDGRATQRFAEAYAQSIARQRARLADATVSDAPFMRALTISSPDFAQRAVTQGPTEPLRNKRARRVETTLFRYLSRAVWRTEPFGLWAGVAIAEWGDRTRIDRASACYAFAPDLRPFVAIFRRLGERPRYRLDGRFMLNPTLERDDDRGNWRYTARFDGAIFERSWKGESGIDALFGVLARLGPSTLADFSSKLTTVGFTSNRLPRMLDALKDAGVLVGGLVFPTRFSSAWGALRIAAGRLVREDARMWHDATRTLRRLCRTLDADLDGLSSGDLANIIESARQVILQLAERLGIDPPDIPRAALRCDTRLPFAVTLGTSDLRWLTAAIDEHDFFESHHGVDCAARRVHRCTMLRDPLARPAIPAFAPGTVPTLESVAAATGDELLRARVARWSTWMAAVDGCVDLTARSGDRGLPLSPVGGLVLRPGAASSLVIGNTTEIGACYGRYWRLFTRDTTRRVARRLHEWYRRALQHAGRRAGIAIVEYAGPCDDAPNALAHPDFGFEVWDRWRPGAHVRRFEVVPRSQAALARDGAEREGLSSIHCFSALNLGYSEPRLERLLLTSFRELPDWLPPGLPLTAERDAHGRAPALVLPGGNRVRESRTVLHGDWLAQFRRAPRPLRFIMWQRLARDQGWPELVLVARDIDPPLPVVRDSPLSLEAALQGLSPSGRFVTVIHVEPRTWLRDGDGNDYATEFVVPHLRRRHAWSDLAAG